MSCSVIQAMAAQITYFDMRHAQLVLRFPKASSLESKSGKYVIAWPAGSTDF